MKVEINGVCKPGFERVRDAFAENFSQGDEVGATVAATVDGEMVVDLWAGYTDESRTHYWARDTIVNVASTTKGVTAICAHHLVDRGLLDLDAPVASYWPEFAQAGKAQIPVHYLLSHRAGLPAVDEPLPTEALYDWNRMTRALAAQAPWWEPGAQHGYHAFTYGWLIGEVVRRVAGKSLGAYWREEIAGPLNIDCQIGLPAGEDARVAEFIPVVPGQLDIDPDFLKSLAPMVEKALNNPSKTVEDMNTREWRGAEIPAGNAHTNARALARVFGALACDGKLDGLQLLSPESIARARSVQASGSDAVLFGIPTRYGLGFSLPPEGQGLGATSPSAFASLGAGGSFAVADPDVRVGFSYVMNKMQAGPPPGSRGLSLIEALYASLAVRTVMAE